MDKCFKSFGSGNVPFLRFRLQRRVIEARRYCVCGLVVGFAVVLCLGAPVWAKAAVVTLTENFDSGVGKFTVAVGNTANGNNFGWSNTAFASGTAGEIGGTYSQGGLGYVADTALSGTLTYTDPIIIKAKAYSLNGGNDQWAGLGYFNYTGNASDANRSGLMAGVGFFQGGGFSRGMVVLNGDWGTPFQLTSNTFDIDLALSFDPVLNQVTFGGTVNGQAVSRTTTAAPTFLKATAFGTLSAYSNGSPPSATAYFDNIQYSAVPEPSAVTLLAMGLTGWVAYVARKRRRMIGKSLFFISTFTD